MADKNKTERDELQDLAEELTKGSPEGSVTYTLAKGLSDAARSMADLLRLSKGGDMADPDDDGDEDEDEEEEYADDKPGYDDMRLGRPSTAQDTVDVTEIFADVAQGMRALSKAVRTIDSLTSKVDGLTREVASLRTENRQLTEAHARISTELAKGVVDLREDLASIPEPLHTPRARGGHRRFGSAPARRPDPETLSVSKVQLLKARQSNVISELESQLYLRAGRFDRDDARNAELMKQVATL